MSAQRRQEESLAAVPSSSTSCSFCSRQRRQVRRLIVAGRAAICSECLGDALEILRREVSSAQNIGETRAGRGMPARAPEGAIAGCFTGDMCNDCGSFRMVRTGTCSTCLDCGGGGGMGCS
jgi:ClpX C4-type zinc finger